MTAKPVPALLAKRPDGSIGLVDQQGRPVADAQTIVITARDLGRALAYHAEAGIEVGRKLGGQAAVESELVQDVEYNADGMVSRIREKRVPASEPTGKPPVGFHKRAAH